MAQSMVQNFTILTFQKTRGYFESRKAGLNAMDQSTLRAALCVRLHISDPHIMKIEHNWKSKVEKSTLKVAIESAEFSLCET